MKYKRDTTEMNLREWALKVRKLVKHVRHDKIISTGRTKHKKRAQN